MIHGEEGIQKMRLEIKNMYFDEGLQIIQADVTLEMNGHLIVDETCCIDVGLPSLVRSVLRDTEPNRWAPEGQWEHVPFFVCSCGDPDCKAFSFLVRHDSHGQLEVTEVEEREHQSYRLYETWKGSREQYARLVVPVARQFIEFVEALNYQPHFFRTVEVIQELLEEIRQEIEA